MMLILHFSTTFVWTELSTRTCKVCVCQKYVYESIKTNKCGGCFKNVESQLNVLHPLKLFYPYYCSLIYAKCICCNQNTMVCC